ncbi:MAG: DUF308 domain-containing protein [Traorella sp.]
MLEKIKKLYGNMLILAIFSLLLGIVLLIYPNVSQKIICYCVAGLFMIYGIVHIAMNSISRKEFTFPKDLVFGILALLIGILLLIFPIVIIRILPIILGGIVFVDGIMKLMNAWDLKKKSYEYWWIILIMGIISITLGILMILDLFEISIILFSGISLIINGICDTFNMLIIAKYKK